MDVRSYAITRDTIIMLLLSCTFSAASAQNFERYKPLQPSEESTELPQIPDADLPPANNDDRVLVDCLNAVIILDHADKVSLAPGVDEAEGLQHDFSAADSLVYSSGIRQIVGQYLGQPLSLRSINQLARDIAKRYQTCGQPIVDVQIPEQRITGGTLQIVVIETRIASVLIDAGDVFSCCELNRWIECTRSGDRVYEKNLKTDLFWLNQNPFRRVSVDFNPGHTDGTTDVTFQSQDVTPIRGYMGADDTGVESLNYGRFFAGVMYGNLFQRGGTLSYQYTTDQEFARLEAHSLSYNQPINRVFSFSSYGSWAGVSPSLGGGLSQNGESWQAGVGVTHHLVRTATHTRELSLGLDFKSTNNNLEFAGSTVAGSAADLVQMRVGYSNFVRKDQNQYRMLKADVMVGPSGGATGAHSAAAFNTLRPGTSPDYVYGRITAESTSVLSDDWMLKARITGQLSSERLLFSETLGLGGFDTIRGFDQRLTNADHGWIANFEFGPRTYRWGAAEEPRSLRPYLFVDVGNGYLAHPQPGEDAYTLIASTGVGLRFNMSDRLSARVDWGYGMEDIAGSPRSNRLHLGLTWIPGPRP